MWACLLGLASRTLWLPCCPLAPVCSWIYAWSEGGGTKRWLCEYCCTVMAKAIAWTHKTGELHQCNHATSLQLEFEYQYTAHTYSLWRLVGSKLPSSSNSSSDSSNASAPKPVFLARLTLYHVTETKTVNNFMMPTTWSGAQHNKLGFTTLLLSKRYNTSHATRLYLKYICCMR